MDIGAILPLPLSTRGYMVYQVFGSALVNAAINFGFAWPMRRLNWIPMFGWSTSIALDTCLTAVLLSALTVLNGSWFVRRDQRRSVVRAFSLPPGSRLRFIPKSTLLRAAVFALGFGTLGTSIGLGGLALFGCDGLRFGAFLLFKLGFAIALGALVTPLNAAVVLWSLPSASRDASARATG